MKTDEDQQQEKKKITSEKPISLYPLTMDEALRDLMQVKPPKERDKKIPKKRKTKK